MNTKHKIIENYAQEQMAKLGLHGWPHVKRVVRLCMQIAEIEKDHVDSEVLEVAALLHDVAKHLEKGGNAFDHGKTSAEMAKNFLNSIGFSRGKVELVRHAIRVHTHGEEPHSIEAKILHDADFLDKMGCVGIATVFIKACLTNTTIEETLEFWKKISRKSFVGLHLLWLQKPHFYTKTAKNLARKRNKIVHTFFKQLEKEIKFKDIQKVVKE